MVSSSGARGQCSGHSRLDVNKSHPLPPLPLLCHLQHQIGHLEMTIRVCVELECASRLRRLNPVAYLQATVQPWFQASGGKVPALSAPSAEQSAYSRPSSWPPVCPAASSSHFAPRHHRLPPGTSPASAETSPGCCSAAGRQSWPLAGIKTSTTPPMA